MAAWAWLSFQFPEVALYLSEHRNDIKQFKIKDLEDLLEKLKGEVKFTEQMIKAEDYTLGMK